MLYNAVFVGAGPSGTGPLIHAAKHNRLSDLLDSGIAIIDKQEQMVKGSIGNYTVNSDTAGGVFLECLRNPDHNPICQVAALPVAQQIDACSSQPVPLSVVGEYLTQVGIALQAVIDRHPASVFIPSTEAHSIACSPDGSFQIRIAGINGGLREIQARSVVMALGGYQDWQTTVASEVLPGITLFPDYLDKVILSDTVLTDAGINTLEVSLNTAQSKKVCILGGSHSALSAAWVLLNRIRGIQFQVGDITILYRNPFRIFYPTIDEAHNDNYFDFTKEDVCPITGRVNRLCGIRHDGKNLLRKLMGLDPEVESRASLVPLNEISGIDLKLLLDQASIIIPAFGYRPRTVPIYDKSGSMVSLNAYRGHPLVDARCRIVRDDGTVIDNLYGIGLASEFQLSGHLGGELSFKCQANGIWLYQNDTGEIILNQLLPEVKFL